MNGDMITRFASSAAANAVRLQLHKSEYMPELEGVNVVEGADGQLLGARVYFVPPVKCVWVAPDHTCTAGSYDPARESQSPLVATFHHIVGDDFEHYTSYANPAKT
jgi:hypothetical protein